MKKQLLIALTSVFMFCNLQAQTDKLWSKHKGTTLVTSKNIERPDFPIDFDLYDLNFNSMKQVLSSAQDRFASAGNGLNTGMQAVAMKASKHCLTQLTNPTKQKIR